MKNVSLTTVVVVHAHEMCQKAMGQEFFYTCFPFVS